MIAIVSVIPVEAIASIQYMSSYFGRASWAKDLVDNGMLTSKGLAAASLLIIIYFFLNYWTVSLFAKVNSLITIFKNHNSWSYNWCIAIRWISWRKLY